MRIYPNCISFKEFEEIVKYNFFKIKDGSCKIKVKNLNKFFMRMTIKMEDFGSDEIVIIKKKICKF